MPYGIWLDLATLASFAIPFIVRQAGLPRARALRYLATASLVLGVFSVATGILNNGTDEPYAQARWLAVVLAGHNPYVYTLSFTYQQFQWYPPPYVATLRSTSTFVYLPLGTLLVIPGGGTGFKAFSLAAWAASVYALRKEPWGALVWSSPSVALIAANGFNDPIPIALLSFALVAAPGRRSSKVLEYLSFGFKQFAPYLMGLYYATRRQWRSVVITVAVTVAFLTPFLIEGPAFAVVCTAFVLPAANCPASYPLPGAAYLHWNYYLWPVWAGAVFLPRLARWCRSAEGRAHFDWAIRRIRPRSRWPSLSFGVAALLAYGHWWTDPVRRRRPFPRRNRSVPLTTDPLENQVE